MISKIGKSGYTAGTEDRAAEGKKLLLEIYTDEYGFDGVFRQANLTNLVNRLNRIVNRKKRPWTWQYLGGVLKGYKGFYASPELTRAIRILATQLDEQSDLIAIIRGPISVYATNGLEDGDIVLGKPKHCLRPACNVRFIPNTPSRIYCCDACKKLYYKEKREQLLSGA